MMGTAVVLGVMFALAQKSPPPREPDAMPPVTDYTHLSSGDVKRIEMKRADGSFVLVRQGDKWAFEAPGAYRADSESVNSWLKGMLEDATVNRVIEGKPSDLSPMGLDKPQVEVVLTSKGGDTRTLQVGKAFTAPDSTNPGPIYAREAKDGRLFMLSSTQVEELKKKKVEDLRDKHLVEVPETKDVQKVSLQRAIGPLEVERRGENKWELLQPFRAPAADIDVEGLISDVRAAQAEAFEDQAAPDPAKYGFDKPQLVFTLSSKKGGGTVSIGGKTPDGTYYAQRQGDPQVMLVSKATFDQLNKKPADLREKKLITLATDKINTMELTNAHASTRLQKTVSIGSSDQWQFADGPNAKQKAKPDIIQTVLTSITAPASKHVEEAPTDLAKYGLEKPQMTVRVSEGSGSSQLFLLGKKTPDGNYYAKGQPNAVFEVQPYVYADLNIKPDAFKDTTKK